MSHHVNSHCLSHVLGQRMVSSWEPPRRRKTPQELRGMLIEDRLIAERWALDLTDAEKTEMLVREDMEAHLGLHHEVHPNLMLMNEATDADWGD